MANYCIIAGLSILFLVGCLVHLSENDIFSVSTIRKFKRIVYVLMFEVVIDCIFVLIAKYDIPIIALSLMKSLELTIIPILCFFVFEVFYDKRMSRQDRIMKRIRKMMILVIAVNCILQMVNIFKKNVFYLDNNKIYHRGPLVFLYIGILFIVILALIFGIFTFSNKTQSIMKATLFSFAVILFASICLRAFFPNNNYDFLCASVAMLFLLIYYSDITLRVDPLTKLLNRQVYQRLIKRIDYATIIIIIDVNNFKAINDTYGHACGDQTLKQLARIICKAYGKYAYCFRTGGDEFCAILKPNAFDKLIEETPHRDIYSMAENTMKKLDDLIEIQNNNEECYLGYGVSQGYGIFYSDTNQSNSEEDMSFKSVIELADKRMYHNKEVFKKDHPELNNI